MEPKRRQSVIGILIPLFLYLGISFGVSMASYFVIAFLKYPEINALLQSGLSFYAVQAKLSNDIMRYSMEIAGVSALVCIPVMSILYRRDRNMEQADSFVKTGVKNFWVWPLIILGGMVLNVGLNMLLTLSNVAALSPAYEETARALYAAPLAVQILCGAIIVPISEELVFRGLIYRRLENRWPARAAAVGSAALFGMVHGNLVQFLFAFAVGLCLCYVYELTGTILAPILLHLSVNLVSFLLSAWKGYSVLENNAFTMGICAIGALLILMIIRQLLELLHKKKLSDNS